MVNPNGASGRGGAAAFAVPESADLARTSCGNMTAEMMAAAHMPREL